MRKSILLLLLIMITSCNNRNELKIKELYKQSTDLIILGKNERAIKIFEEIIDIDNQSSVAYMELYGLYFQKGQFKKALEFNQKLIELNPDMYYYYMQRGGALKFLNRNEESELNYMKARELFKMKEDYFWSSRDSLSMALMLIEVGDSIHGRAVIDSIIKKNINTWMSVEDLRKLQNQTLGETFNEMKLYIELNTSSEIMNNREVERIFEDRN